MRVYFCLFLRIHEVLEYSGLFLQRQRGEGRGREIERKHHRGEAQ